VSQPPRVLFLSPPMQDYLADGVFHGLRELLGADAVDYPKREFMYASYPAARRPHLYGRGFSLYCLLDDIEVDRTAPLWDALHGAFDLVVFGDVTRDFGSFVQLGPDLQRAGTPMVILDGSDSPAMYPYGPRWWRRPGWWLLPRAHRRGPYYKRELTDVTGWLRSYGVVPPPLSRRVPLRNVRGTSFSLPASKLVPLDEPAVKTKEFPAHVVDEEVARRIGAGMGYAFEREQDYHADLRASRFGITTRKSGWDCLRHYEIAANGAVPCFRHLHRKPASCAPHGLVDGRNCIAYDGYDELAAKIARLPDDVYDRLRAGALAWAHANTTRARAAQLLGDLGFSAPVATVAAARS
jgi:hypothetical protein